MSINVTKAQAKFLLDASLGFEVTNSLEQVMSGVKVSDSILDVINQLKTITMTPDENQEVVEPTPVAVEPTPEQAA